MTDFDEIYWGCHACGHEVAKDAKECWDCEKPREFVWLNELGEYASKEQIDAHLAKKK